MGSAPSIDYAAAAMRASRRCYACGRTYDAERVHADPAWTPRRSGWRCGDCTRARRSEVNTRARELIARAEPRWEIALRTPEHGPFDDCLDCEAALAAREIVLARGGLTRGLAVVVGALVGQPLWRSTLRAEWMDRLPHAGFRHRARAVPVAAPLAALAGAGTPR